MIVMPKTNKSKKRSDKEFDDELKRDYDKVNKVPKTQYRGLLGTKEGMQILKKMTWIEIEDLTDLEFFGE